MSGTTQETLFALLREHSSDAIPAATTDRLFEAALDSEGRSALLALVNRPRLTNAARLAVLDALRETLELEDAATLARAVVKQQPSVLLFALRLLEESRSPAALFAVRKPLRRGEPEIDAACDRAAARLAMDVDAERYVRRDGVPPTDFPARDLAYAAAAAAPETLAAIRLRGTDPRLTELLGRGIEELLDELATQARLASLNDFDSRLRDELHEVVLLTGIPSDAGQQELSLDNLFRRGDLAEVRQIASELPETALVRYAARALKRANRRSERADRAVLALSMLESARAASSGQLHDALFECLDERDPALVGGAVAALATRADELSPTERRRVIGRFGTLPAEQQQALAPRLSGLATSASEALDVESFLRWVDGSPEAEQPARLQALKTRWDTTVVTSEQATSFLRTFARGVHRLAPDQQAAWREDLVESPLSWMYRQGTQIVEASRALLGWPGFAGLVLEDLDLALSLLRPEQGRGLLNQVFRQAEDPVSVVTAIAAADVSEAEARRVVIPVLREAMRRDLRSTDAAFQGAEPAAQRRLLHAALVTANEAKHEIDSLGQTTQDAAAAATAQHGAAVLAALDSAEGASEGNDAIQGHFDAVRRAIGSVLASREGTEVPEGVVRWRNATAERFPDAVAEPDGDSPIRLREGAPRGEVMRVVAELDQRVHSPRVVSAEERNHLRQDLLRCIDYIVDEHLAEEATASALSGRAALGQLVWARWVERAEDPGTDLINVLITPVEPQGRQQALLKVDALASRLEEETMVAAVHTVPIDALAGAWALVTAGLANRLRQVEKLEQEAKSRGVEVMERVAERLDPPLRAIEGLMVGYFRLRRQLSAAGWRPIEETLGKELRRDQLHPDRHEIDGSSEADRFVVRSMGVRVGSRPIRRAVVEPLEAEGER